MIGSLSQILRIEEFDQVAPGPMPRTVREPAAICVRPLQLSQLLFSDGSSITHASCMDRAQRFRLRAMASNVSISSSLTTRSATLLCL